MRFWRLTNGHIYNILREWKVILSSWMERLQILPDHRNILQKFHHYTLPADIVTVLSSIIWLRNLLLWMRLWQVTLVESSFYFDLYCFFIKFCSIESKVFVLFKFKHCHKVYTFSTTHDSRNTFMANVQILFLQL